MEKKLLELFTKKSCNSDRKSNLFREKIKNYMSNGKVMVILLTVWIDKNDTLYQNELFSRTTC